MKRFRRWISGDDGETAFALAMTLLAACALAALIVWGPHA